MSFLDRVTKAVGDAVDRGKKEVDQFVRIQKINGEINDMERNVAEFKSQIMQTRQLAGEKAIEMLRKGTLVCPELQSFLEQIGGIEKQIAAEEEKIAGKRVEIEKLKTEREAEEAATPSTRPPAASEAPVVPPPMPAGTSPATPPPLTHFCPQCGAQLTSGGSFCSQCGSKLG